MYLYRIRYVDPLEVDRLNIAKVKAEMLAAGQRWVKVDQVKGHPARVPEQPGIQVRLSG